MAQRGLKDPKKPTKNETTLFEAGAPLETKLSYAYADEMIEGARQAARVAAYQQPERDCARRTAGGSGKQRPIREVQPEGQALGATATSPLSLPKHLLLVPPTPSS